MAALTLEVWSDVLCPWCFIGSRHLAAARAATHHDVTVTWRAFQLDPTLDDTGITNRDRLVEKFGGEANYDAAAQRVSEKGAEVGIAFDHPSVRAANTLRAHQLISLATDEGKADDVVAGLFSALFEQGRNIADPAALQSVAAAAGIGSPDDTVAAVMADARLDVVRGEITEAGRLGIHGVPTFVADRRVGVSGAVPPETLLHLFDQAATTTP